MEREKGLSVKIQGSLITGNPPMPNGLQRFLAKKGINSPNDLFNRVQNAPRMSFRRGQ